MKNRILFLALTLLSLITYGQNVGIGTSSPNALLDVYSTADGILIPRVALTGTASASPLSSPTASTLVYNTATAGSGATAVSPGFYYWSGTAWVRFIDNNSLTGSTTVSNTSTDNTLSTTVNGITGSTVPLINTNVLSQNGSNQLINTINGLGSSPYTVGITGDVTGNLGASTVGKIQGTPVSISSLTNGNLLQYSSSGTNWVNVTPASILGAATTNSLSLSTNTLTSTVNGVAATSSAVSAVSNTSSANTISTSVNGVTGSTVPIINTNAIGLSGTTLTSTVNGFASNTLDISSVDKNIYNSDGTLTGARTVTMTGNTLNFTGGNVGIGIAVPTAQLHTSGTVTFANYPSGLLSTNASGNLQTTTVITNNGNQIDVVNGNGVSGNPAISIDNAYAASVKAGFILSGGGNITYNGSAISWSSRFIVINNGTGSQFSTNGYFDINQPASGTVITGVGSSGNVTVTASGVPLGCWDALYYILPVGSSNGVINSNFRIVQYGAGFVVPETWILLAAQNCDDGTVKVGNGVILASGQTWTSGQGTAGSASTSGTTNHVAKFTSASSIGNSVITDDGNTVVFNPPTYTYFSTGTVYAQNELIARGSIYNDGGSLTLNGSNSIVNASGGYLQVGSAYALQGTDSWLRLNQNGSFASGTYTPGFLRADGGIASGGVGSLGSGTIIATSTIEGNGYVDYSSGQQVIDAGGGWHRSYGNTGWYNGTYGIGLYATDATWVRTYNNASFWAGSGNICTAGKIGAGTSAPAYPLDVVGNMHASSNLYLDGGTIYATSRTNYYLALQSDRNLVLYDGGVAKWASGTSTSDIRTKDHVIPLEEMLPTIMKLSTIRFNYKKELDMGDEQHIGLIAQEINKYFPDMVYLDKKSDRYLVYYDKLVTVLIKGMQEQQKKIDELAEEQKANLTLKQQNCDMRYDIDKLKASVETLQQIIGTKAEK